MINNTHKKNNIKAKVPTKRDTDSFRLTYIMVALIDGLFDGVMQ